MSWTPTLMQKFVTICPGVSFSGVKQAKHLEQATDQEMRCREILFTPRRSPRAREFPRSCQLFCTTYGCGVRGIKIAQFSDFGLFSHTKRLITYLPVTTLQPRGYIADDSDFSVW